MNKKLSKILGSLPPVTYVFIVAVILFGVLAPNFFELSNLSSIATQTSMLLIVSVGVTFVVLTEGIDLSTGSVISFSTVMWIFLMSKGLNVGIAALVTLLAAMAIGLVNGLIVGVGRVPAFIVTLGMQSVVAGLALVLTNGNSIYFSHQIFRFITDGRILFIPVMIVVSLVLYAISWILLYHTKFGARIYGLGGNEDSIVLAGKKPVIYYVGAYVFASFMAGVVGLLIASRIESGNPVAGVGWEFDAIAAVLLGGTSRQQGNGGIGGTVIGVLLITLLRNGLNVIGISAMYQSAMIGSTVLLAIVIDAYAKNMKTKSMEER